MKTATKPLLMLVVVLGFVNEAVADQSLVVTDHEYLIHVGDSCFGFQDGHLEWARRGELWSKVSFGQREFDVSFTATQGLVGFCLIVVGLIVLVTALAVRWKRKQPSRL